MATAPIESGGFLFAGFCLLRDRSGARRHGLARAMSQGNRIAVLVDTSASMRRGNLWPRAKALAREVIASCRPVDELAVFSFDDSFRQVLGFAESSGTRGRSSARPLPLLLSNSWRHPGGRPIWGKP